MNGLEYTIRAAEDVVIPKPQDTKPFASKESIAATVVLTVGVLRSVSFDDQSTFETDEIDDIGGNDHLPFELEHWHPLVAKH